MHRSILGGTARVGAIGFAVTFWSSTTRYCPCSPVELRCLRSLARGDAHPRDGRALPDRIAALTFCVPKRNSGARCRRPPSVTRHLRTPVNQIPTHVNVPATARRPHPGNLLGTKQNSRSSSIETCCRGPIEFDLLMCRTRQRALPGLTGPCSRIVGGRLAMVPVGAGRRRFRTAAARRQFLGFSENGHHGPLWSPLHRYGAPRCASRGGRCPSLSPRDVLSCPWLESRAGLPAGGAVAPSPPAAQPYGK